MTGIHLISHLTRNIPVYSSFSAGYIKRKPAKGGEYTMPKHRKQLPMEQILKMTKGLSPSDLADSKFETGEALDVQAMIERRDDGKMIPHPSAIHPGDDRYEQ